MDSSQIDKPNSVRDEDYKGSNAGIIALGYSSALHMASTAIAVIGMGGLGYWRYKEGGEIISSIRKHVAKWEPAGDRILSRLVGKEHSVALDTAIKSSNIAIDGAKDELRQLVHESDRGFFQRIAADFLGVFNIKEPSLGNLEAKSRFRSGTFFAGVGMIGGTILSLGLGIFHGKRKSDDGKDQFSRAQDQIQDLQEEKKDLTRINDQLREKYIKAATHLDALQSAQSAQTEDTGSDLSENDAAPAPKSDVANIQHQGHLAQQQALAAGVN
jgi:hypothetical protein